MESTAKISSTPCGAIDLGSNTFRLLIATFDGHKIKTLEKMMRSVRLAGGLAKTGHLSPEGVISGLETLTEFKEYLDKHGVSRCACYGTEALRRAKDRKEFVSSAAKSLEFDIEILTGSREAELSTSGVIAGLYDSISQPTLIADVGGGSTEISYINENGCLVKNLSLPHGAVALSEQNFQYSMDAYQHVHESLREFITDILNHQKPKLIGTGGTATTIAMLDLELESYIEKKVHGHDVLKSRLDRITDKLSGLSTAERNCLPGLEHGRGEIIVAGCKIYQEIIATIGGEGMIVSDWGLLEGIFLDGVKNYSSGEPR